MPLTRRLARTLVGLRRRRLVLVSLAAVPVGLAVGVLAIGFRLAILEVQNLLLGTRQENLLAGLINQPDWRIALAPVAGGLLVGLALHLWGRERPAGLVDVIDARARFGGQMAFAPALGHAGLSALSLGAGASTGREGPVVHLGGAMASFFAARLGLPPRFARMLLACGAAAAVSASFNAPIAGVLFAFEVILGSYALRAMAPVALASVTGAVLTRLYFGEDDLSFRVPPLDLVSYFEMPAFVVLGALAALSAMALIQSIQHAERAAARVPVPVFLRPALGGAVVGLIALELPEILGVGYDAINGALGGAFPWPLLLLLLAVKIAATALCVSSRFGGGIFTPSLFIGAMAGGAFGFGLDALFPDQVSGSSAYALVGMGAVAAAVLGAPLSTTLIVFELTGNYPMTIALLVSASFATLLTQSILGHSYFQWQMAARGLDLTGGSYTAVLNTIRVSDFMAPVAGATSRIEDALPVTYPEASLERVLALLEENDLDSIAVVDRDFPSRLLGFVSYKSALRIYKNALVATNIEEHQ